MATPKGSVFRGNADLAAPPPGARVVQSPAPVSANSLTPSLQRPTTMVVPERHKSSVATRAGSPNPLAGLPAARGLSTRTTAAQPVGLHLPGIVEAKTMATVRDPLPFAASAEFVNKPARKSPSSLRQAAPRVVLARSLSLQPRDITVPAVEKLKSMGLAAGRSANPDAGLVGPRLTSSRNPLLPSSVSTSGHPIPPHRLGDIHRSGPYIIDTPETETFETSGMTPLQVRLHAFKAGNIVEVDWTFLTYPPANIVLRKEYLQQAYGGLAHYADNTVGAAINEIFKYDAPNAPWTLLKETGLSINTHYHTAGVSYLPRLLLPFHAPMDWHDKLSIMRSPGKYAADQYGRGAPPGKPPDGLTWDGFTDLCSSFQDAVESALSDARAAIRDVTDSPLWKIVQTGVSLVPGIGTAVSIGMSAAYAYGHHLSLGDSIMETARGLLPGGVAANTAFDIAVGLVEGQSLEEAAINAAREQLPPGIPRYAFDRGLDAASGHDPTEQARQDAENAARKVFDEETKLFS